MILIMKSSYEERELIKALALAQYFINRLRNILPEHLIPYGCILYHTEKSFKV
jgi:hypothetical protein